MKTQECGEEQFVRDFFPLIADLWYGNHYVAGNPQHAEHIKKTIHVTFEDFSVILCAYTEEGEPIGYFWYKHDTGIEGVHFSGRDAHIIQCGLFEKFQRQGIGTALLNEVCKKVKANGGEFLYTDTYAADNVPAMTFYIKKGFIPFAMFPGLNGTDDYGQVYLYKKL